LALADPQMHFPSCKASSAQPADGAHRLPAKKHAVSVEEIVESDYL